MEHHRGGADRRRRRWRPRQASRSKGRVIPLVGLSGDAKEAPRIQTKVPELDRVTGGGFVRGSALLVGGDPGIGKSTLLIQAAAQLANLGHKTVYISGEEAIGQVRLRAERLGLAQAPVHWLRKRALKTFWRRWNPTRRRPFSSSTPFRRSGQTRWNLLPAP